MDASILKMAVDSTLKELPTGKTFYIGFDPTADSLHIGSLYPILVAKHLISLGNKCIVVIGNSTAKIGDPSGKDKERTLLDPNIVEQNSFCLEKQIRFLLREEVLQNSVKFIRNSDWLDSFETIAFLRFVGKHVSINELLNKSSIQKRLEKGLSLTEFLYPVLQAFDFAYLAKNHNCSLQIGGSDQWGNICLGMDLARKIFEIEDVGGLTFPLITKEDGTKFGKSEEGANIWLDSSKTTPFDLHQFFFNLTDPMADKLCELFSIAFNEEEMKILKDTELKNKNERAKQKLLSKFVLKIVHNITEIPIPVVKTQTKNIRELLVEVGFCFKQK